LVNLERSWVGARFSAIERPVIKSDLNGKPVFTSIANLDKQYIHGREHLANDILKQRQARQATPMRTARVRLFDGNTQRERTEDAKATKIRHLPMNVVQEALAVVHPLPRAGVLSAPLTRRRQLGIFVLWPSYAAAAMASAAWGRSVSGTNDEVTPHWP
jgi:hypothetical protein